MARLKGVLLGISVVGWLASAPSAMAFNHHITVYAQVPQMRSVYVDKAGLITKIAGNTSENITPKVYDDEFNQPQPLTDSVMRQYQQFLDEHKVLEAGKTYDVGHEVGAHALDSHQVTIDASLRLGSDQND
jgi:hypothetical protein